MIDLRDIARRPPAGLVAAYLFDGDGRDVSPWGNDLTLAGSPTVDGGLNLNGSSQYAYATDPAHLSFGDGSSDSPCSIFSVVTMDDATRFRLVQKWGGTSSNREWIFGTDGGDDLRMTLQDDSAGRFDRYTTTSLTAQEGSRISLGCSYSGSGTVSGIELYVNAAAPATTTFTSGSYSSMENTTAPLEVGSIQADSTYANGIIHALLVFNRVLSTDEFALLHAAGGNL